MVVVRTIVKLVGAIVLVAVSVFGGAAYQNHADVAAVAARQSDTVAIVGIVACGHMMGAVTVERSGKLDAHQDMAPADLFAVSKQLPEQNAGVVTIPCPQGAGSPPIGQDQT